MIALHSYSYSKRRRAALGQKRKDPSARERQPDGRQASEHEGRDLVVRRTGPDAYSVHSETEPLHDPVGAAIARHEPPEALDTPVRWQCTHWVAEWVRHDRSVRRDPPEHDNVRQRGP